MRDFFRGPPPSRPRPSSGAPVPLAVWSPTRPESVSGRAAGRAPWRPRERPVCGAPMEHVQSKYLGLGFVLSRARPIASAPGPLERVCGERFGCPPAPSYSPGARSAACPGCRVGALIVVHVVKFMSIHIRSSCVFLRPFVVPLKYSHWSAGAASGSMSPPALSPPPDARPVGAPGMPRGRPF